MNGVLTGMVVLPIDTMVAVYVPIDMVVPELVSITLLVIFIPEIRVGFVKPPKLNNPVVIKVPIPTDSPFSIGSIVFVFIVLKVFVPVQTLDSVKKLAMADVK